MMSAINITAEPEETIEVAICALLASNCTIPVQGLMTPASVGKVKHLSSDTCVTVSVDLSSQDLDLSTPASFITLTATIGVHFAQCDDASGSSFRDECRIVRSALRSLTGDGCSALTSGDIAVDGFIFETTSSQFEAGENPTTSKIYTAKIFCRVVQQQEEQQTQQLTEEAENG